MRKYSKFASFAGFIASIVILIVGIIKTINGMIIGGVIGITCSAMVFMALMVQRSTGEPPKTVKVTNPLPDV